MELPLKTLIIFPKEEIRNLFGQIIYHYGKGYECTFLPPYSETSGTSFEPNPRKLISEDTYYVVKCELIGNEYPTLNLDEIRKDFYINEEWRDFRIETLLK